MPLGTLSAIAVEETVESSRLEHALNSDTPRNAVIQLLISSLGLARVAECGRAKLSAAHFAKMARLPDFKWAAAADDDNHEDDEDEDEEEEERTEVAVREDVVVEEMAEAAVMLVDDTDLVELVDESRDEERAEERPLRPPISANVASPVEEAAVCPMVDASTPLSTIGGDGYGRRSGPRNISRNSIHSLIS